MIAKKHLKFIKSLQIKKFRRIYNQFLVEGAKNIAELLKSDFEISSLFLTKEFEQLCAGELKHRNMPVNIVSEEDLQRAGSFSSNNAGIAIVHMKSQKSLAPHENEYLLMLDEVKDPGNLGTIIRIADWYGIKKVLCSENTAELYNPKVISSTMGSFTRVNVWYGDLVKYLKEHPDLPVYGAMLGGENIYSVDFSSKGILVMGSESAGISDELKKHITTEIAIPGRGGAESLNVGVATGIICDNIARSLHSKG
ncbi:RNA methyltransferase [Cytophagaceae bacterium ABcell3]|nr:RNA methyltransferase [Cytophagaceae bacterium ABcell3]